MSANIQFENIPACLKTLPNWILHRNKIPMQTSGLAASSTDPATWTTFEAAIANAERFDGIGFVFTGTEFSGVDLDDVRDPETGKVEQWAAELVSQLDSYTELSPSQTGVHVIVRGKIPKAIKRKKIEIYPDARYFTITGRKSSSVSENVETRDLSGLFAKVQAGAFDTPEEKAAAKAVAPDQDAPILEGSRDNTLTSIGGRLRYAGLTFEEIRDALTRINQERCTPPLPSTDVERIARSVSNYAIGRDGSQDVLIGGNVAGTAATKPAAAADVSKWADAFKSVSELESGDVQMLIDGFLPEGVTCIGALPAEGKTLFALSIAKALTTGEDFLGQISFPVPRIVPVVYLIPESGARAFRRRCEKFRIPADRNRFLCRTISEGSTILLDDPILREAVRVLRPVVIMDTLTRFSTANDENAAAQNKKLVDDIVALRQAGAVGVIALHHSVKASRGQAMALETVLRGSGDIAAMCDAVYGLQRDDALYAQGIGPNEITVACVKPRDFEPPAPFRIAASERIPAGSTNGLAVGEAPGIRSVIDRAGDFRFMSALAATEQQTDMLVRLVQEYPEITGDQVAEQTRMSKWKVKRLLNAAGWHRPNGGASANRRWYKKPDVAAEVQAVVGDQGRPEQASAASVG